MLVSFLQSQNLLSTIIEMAGGPHMVTGLRGSCKLGSLLIPAPEHMTANKFLKRAAKRGDANMCRHAKTAYGADNFDGMLFGAASKGHAGICVLAKDWGAQDFDGMLSRAAKMGHTELCYMAKAWGSTWFSKMIMSAASGGHADLCELGRKWYVECDDLEYANLPGINCNDILVAATKSGHENICRLAKEWGADDLFRMMACAALQNNERLCRLAKEWGAVPYDTMLAYAAFGGHVSICRLAREWILEEADDFYLDATFDTMLAAAAAGGHEKLCRLAIEWGSSDINLMLYGASSGTFGDSFFCNETTRYIAEDAFTSIKLCRIAKEEYGADDFNTMFINGCYGGNDEICELAIEWGATNVDSALKYYASEGCEQGCIKAKDKWGATDFNGMLREAARFGHIDICKLAREWGATSTDFIGMLLVRQRQTEFSTRDQLF